MELIGECMTHLVKADEEHVTDNEFGEVSLVGEHLLDARLGGIVAGGNVLVPSGGERVRSGADRESQSKDDVPKHGESQIVSDGSLLTEPFGQIWEKRQKSMTEPFGQI
jgi:hypothetical protein